MSENETTQAKPILPRRQRRRVEALREARAALNNSNGPLGGDVLPEHRSVADLVVLAEYLLHGSAAYDAYYYEEVTDAR